MARPTQLDLNAEQAWLSVPMPGANLPIDIVPLASHPDDFVILARFPAGFVRDVPGGYLAAETFLVLEGGLVLNGHRVRRADLTHVPASCLRSDMRSQEGCLALAWFSGAADYLTPSELGSTDDEIKTVSIATAAGGRLMTTPEAEWTVGEIGAAESVDLELTTWSASGVGAPSPSGLVRVRR